MRNVVYRLFLAALVLLLVSCPSPTKPQDSGSPPGGSVPAGSPPGEAPATGTLVINLPPITMQQVVDPKNPPAVLPLSSYDVLGSGPGSASFQKLGVTDTSVMIDSLQPGDWGVTVNGNDMNGTQVASASVHATVRAGETASAAVVVSATVGQGTFDVSMEWPTGVTVSSPLATLTPLAGLPIVIPLEGTASGGGFTAHQTATAPAGYAILSISYLDGNDFRWGGAEAVYVAAGGSTKILFAPFSTSKKLTIDPDISKAIPIALTGSKDRFGQGEDVSITATPQEMSSGKSISYLWYLNGLAQPATDATITFPRKTLGGDYRLDVVIATHGTLASDHVIFAVAGN